MLLRQTVTVCCENHTTDVNVLCGKMQSFEYSSRRYISYSWALESSERLHFKTPIKIALKCNRIWI
jgi:hypothetical protein